ncbi:MAG TPA: hypothetical protein VMW50_14865 [Dehalococcoidia bacterium]|nr:hypothetical protein [Dehalococcoidia bacterium]
MIKAEDIEQTLTDVAGLNPADTRQWVAEHIYDMPCLLAYLLGATGIKVKENTLNVLVLPACDLCGRVAGYRAKDHDGQWKDMCERCFPIHGTGLGRDENGVYTGRKLELVKL